MNPNENTNNEVPVENRTDVPGVYRSELNDPSELNDNDNDKDALDENVCQIVLPESLIEGPNIKQDTNVLLKESFVKKFGPHQRRDFPNLGGLAAHGALDQIPEE